MKHHGKGHQVRVVIEDDLGRSSIHDYFGPPLTHPYNLQTNLTQTMLRDLLALRDLPLQ